MARNPSKLTRRELLARGARAALGVGSMPAAWRWVANDRPPPDSASALVARLVLETKREATLDAVARAVRDHGLSPRDVVAGVHRAAARSVIPTRYLGSEFHALLMAHPFAVTSGLMPAASTFEPILLAVDYCKRIQALHLERGAATSLPALADRPAVDEERSLSALTKALDDWDLAAADVAVTDAAVAAGRTRTFDLLFRYGARDLRQIGHKTILVANAWHVTAAVPWGECGPTLRSLVRGLLLHEDGNPNTRSSPFDLPWRRSRREVERLPAGWRGGEADRTREFLAAFRTESIGDIIGEVADLLRAGASIDSFWTACACGSAELVFGWPVSIVTLHAVTTTNALRTSFEHATTDESRRLIVLQAAARLVEFRDKAVELLGTPTSPIRIEDLEPMAGDGPEPGAPAPDGLPPAEWASRMLAVLGQRDHAALWRELAPRLFACALDIHDFKHPIAVYEDALAMPRPWADRYLALTLRDLRLTPGELPPEHEKHAHKFWRDDAVSDRMRAAHRTIQG